MYRRKTSLKKDLEHLIYRHFWTSTRKTCISNGKIFAGLSNQLFMWPEEHLQGNFSERKSCKLMDFWINFVNFGTMAEKNFSGLSKQQKMSKGTAYGKSFLKTEKIAFFLILSVFLLQAKTFTRFAKAAVYVCLEVCGEEQFLKLIKKFTLLWILIQKTLSRKMFLLGCHNCNPCI